MGVDRDSTNEDETNLLSSRLRQVGRVWPSLSGNPVLDEVPNGSATVSADAPPTPSRVLAQAGWFTMSLTCGMTSRP